MEAFNHQSRRVGTAVLERITALKIGQKMQDLPEHLWHESFKFYVKMDPNRRGGPNLRMIRLDPNRPSLTVTAFIFNKFVHPFEDRFVSAREAARLQGFPDSYEFKGPLTSVQLQVGNAVPVQLGQAIFKEIFTQFRRKHQEGRPITALSLFSGAGGFDLAFRSAGENFQACRTLAAIEYDKDCCATLANSFGADTRIFHSDIASIKDPAAFLAEFGLKPRELGLVYGGPPCQAFSQAGKQRGLSDPRGQLISEFIRFIDILRPKFFVMENVRGLISAHGGALVKEVMGTFQNLGYEIDFGVLNAADFGTPQLRRRFICLGSRKGMPKAYLPSPTHSESPTLLSPTPHVTVREAFKGLPKISI